MPAWISNNKSELKYLFFYFGFILGFATYYFVNSEDYKNLNSFVDAIYLSAITVTTLGYGDIIPVTPAAKIATGSQAVVGILVIGFFLNAVASKLSKRVRDDEAERSAEIYRRSRLQRIQTQWVAVLPTIRKLADVSRNLSSPKGQHIEPEDWVISVLKSEIPVSNFRDFSEQVLSHTDEMFLPGPMAFNHWNEKLMTDFRQLLLDVDPEVFPEIFKTIELFFELPEIPSHLALKETKTFMMRKKTLVERLSEIYSDWDNPKYDGDPHRNSAKQVYDAVTQRCRVAFSIDKLIKIEAGK